MDAFFVGEPNRPVASDGHVNVFVVGQNRYYCDSRPLPDGVWLAFHLPEIVGYVVGKVCWGISGVLECCHNAESSTCPVVGNLLSLHDVEGIDDNAGRKPKVETVRSGRLSGSRRNQTDDGGAPRSSPSPPSHQLLNDLPGVKRTVDSLFCQVDGIQVSVPLSVASMGSDIPLCHENA